MPAKKSAVSRTILSTASLLRSVKDKPVYCQLPAATVEPYGNGLSVYRLSQTVLYYNLDFALEFVPEFTLEFASKFLLEFIGEVLMSPTVGASRHQI